MCEECSYAWADDVPVCSGCGHQDDECEEVDSGSLEGLWMVCPDCREESGDPVKVQAPH